VLSRGGFVSFDNSGTISGTTRAGVNSNGAVDTFTNSGLIEGGNWDAVFLSGGVGSFTNTATSVIRNINNNGVAGNGVAFSTDLVEGGAVGSFRNEGAISADPNLPDGTGVGFFDEGNGAFTTGSFFNSGTITGTGDAVYSAGNIGTFTDTGTIAGGDYSGIGVEGAVTSFTNSGDITASDGRGVSLYGFVDSLSNTGSIVSSANGVTFGSGFGTATNSGTIISTDASGEIGVRIDEAGGTFTNLGTISGPSGALYILDALRTGSPWRDLPEPYGPYTTVYNRQAKAGVWLTIFETLAARSPKSMQMIDSSIIRARQHAAGGKRGPRSRHRPFSWRTEHQDSRGHRSGWPAGAPASFARLGLRHERGSRTSRRPACSHDRPRRSGLRFKCRADVDRPDRRPAQHPELLAPKSQALHRPQHLPPAQSNRTLLLPTQTFPPRRDPL
jgi:hypothetical protein